MVVSPKRSSITALRSERFKRFAGAEVAYQNRRANPPIARLTWQGC